MRRFAANPAWKKRDYFLIVSACVCVPLDLLSFLSCVAQGGKTAAVAILPLLLAAMGVVGLYRELPKADDPRPPLPEGPFRTAQAGVPDPLRVSRLGRGLLGAYLAIHLLLLVAAIVAAVIVIVIIGLILYTCGKH
jgi:hypothetical protein